MKLIIAIIRPEKLEAVEAVLNAVGASVLAVSQVIGLGRETGSAMIHRDREIQRPLSKIRMEIAADDRSVTAAVDAILRAGSSGDASRMTDGNVLVMELDQYICIGNGERGAIEF